MLERERERRGRTGIEVRPRRFANGTASRVKTVSGLMTKNSGGRTGNVV